MLKKSLALCVVLVLVSLYVFSINVFAVDYTNGVSVAGSTATIWFKSNVSTTWVDVHYTVNAGAQQNIRTTYNSGLARYEQNVPVSNGNLISYAFTYNNGAPAYDTPWFNYTVGSATPTPTPTSAATATPTPNGTATPTPAATPTPTPGGSNSIYSISAGSIPAPSGSGVMTVKVMNGTNGAYPDNQVYWGVLGINPANGLWSYLDINGNLQPISAALNNASGHLTKNGVNYANIYHTVADASWVSFPKITSGRMFLSVGTPCYITTYDTGFAGPDINNPTDPNANIYFDFVEFTVNDSGYHGNTTRVDGFGFPVQHRLVNKAGNYDLTVGEPESETRAGIFNEYANEVPSQFKSLGTVQAPYRIVAPIHGSFAAGGANANYFAGYSSVSTQDILMGVGGAADPGTCAAINRHIYQDPAHWNTPSYYYLAAPANYYAKFWHTHGISGLAYGFCYDDVNGQAAYLEVGDPKGLIVRVGW